MLVLVQLDISEADMKLFEEYETQALGLLRKHGAQLLERLRSADEKQEVHLLQFPDINALDAFRADPARARLQDLWLRCGASTSLTEVRRLGQP